MNYQTFAPQEELAELVKCFWSLEAPAEAIPEKQHIVPDGCMEMIFHYGSHYRQYHADGSSEVQPRSFVFGQITRPLEIAPTGETGIIAARFHPDGFAPFAAIPLSEMENRAVPLELLFGRAGSSLEAAVLAAPDNAARIALITAFLLQQLTSPETAERMSTMAIALMQQLNGQVTVGELAERLSIHRRSLERQFATAAGISPKQLSKIIRLQAAIRLLGRQQCGSLTELAYESGYADQSHFIRDFREFTGTSPRQFYAGNLRMTALFAGTE